MDKYKAEERRQLELQQKSNGYWLQFLEGQLQNHEPLYAMDQYPSILDKLSAADVKEAAKKYLSGENYIRLVLLPEKAQQ